LAEPGSAPASVIRRSRAAGCGSRTPSAWPQPGSGATPNALTGAGLGLGGARRGRLRPALQDRPDPPLTIGVDHHAGPIWVATILADGSAMGRPPRGCTDPPTRNRPRTVPRFRAGVARSARAAAYRRSPAAAPLDRAGQVEPVHRPTPINVGR